MPGEVVPSLGRFDPDSWGEGVDESDTESEISDVSDLGSLDDISLRGSRSPGRHTPGGWTYDMTRKPSPRVSEPPSKSGNELYNEYVKSAPQAAPEVPAEAPGGRTAPAQANREPLPPQISDTRAQRAPQRQSTSAATPVAAIPSKPGRKTALQRRREKDARANTISGATESRIVSGRVKELPS